MLLETTLFACADCGLHVRRTDLRCPHCDAPMRTAQGGIPQTRTAMAMGLSFLAITTTATACTNVVDVRGDDGAGGSGGAGTQSTSSSKTTKSTATSPTTNTSTNQVSQTATVTNSIAAYGTGFTMSCDAIGNCLGDGVPEQGCAECAALGGAPYYDSGVCSNNYFACMGSTGDCSDGEPECCLVNDCLSSCLGNPDEYWPCACGSPDEASCVLAAAAAGTCFGDYPTGTALMFGPQGWITCVEEVCVTSCD
ncbi:MAG: hypothetical protein HOV80_03505 [Polyangiaceae bacterium]|nr:hypothetical protein [Polyangiaceae bacterium]